jgi:hypothetical protein
MAHQGSDCGKCEDEKKQLNDKIWNLSIMVLQKNQVIGDQNTAMARTDSLVRSKTETPTKELLKELNK